MKLYRIQAIMLRHLLITFRVLQRIIDLMFWPFINIVIWGFSSLWNQQFQGQSFKVTLALLTALLMWQILFRINLEICHSLLDEITSFNVSNLFATPLKLSEWILAVVGVGFVKSLFTFCFGIFCSWALYSINILQIGWHLIPFIALGVFSGWVVGFLAASAIVYWGQSVRELVWVVPWLFVPLSGIFYSIDILPRWVQVISSALPMPYLFESLRHYILTGILPLHSLMIGSAITVFYALLALIFFKIIFEKSRSKGLSRLENS